MLIRLFLAVKLSKREGGLTIRVETRTAYILGRLRSCLPPFGKVSIQTRSLSSAYYSLFSRYNKKPVGSRI